MRAIDPELFGPDQQCFGCGPTNPVGMKLHFHRDGEDAVVTTLHPRPGWEGAPGVLHGGLQATLIDELGAWTVVAVTGNFGFTTSMQVRYLRPVRADQPVDGRGELVERGASTARVRIRLTQGGDALAMATVSYLLPTLAQAESIMGGPVPEAWRHLTRDGVDDDASSA